MTTAQLNRGQDILSEINDLTKALTTLNSDNFFKITNNPCIRELSDPFLVVLNLQMKELGVSEIDKRIKLLELEFKSL